jgi:molybdenum cofactor cytidylyltransferase
VLQHVLDAAQASPLDEIVVVLGHAAHEIAAAVKIMGRARIAINPDFASGQSTSLRTGLRAADAGSSAAVFLLGDQPGVRVDAIGAVVDAWRGGSGPVVQASYAGRPSHPTLFDRSTWSELERAEGDEAARGVLARHSEWRVLVEVGGTPPDDLDTEEDYTRLRGEFEGGV